MELLEFIKGNYYSKNEIEKFGCSYIKETSQTAFYRKDEMLYVFEAKSIGKLSGYKLITIIKD